MGAREGSEVGAGEGSEVGAGEGSELGAGEGSELGAGEGSELGAGEGSEVGIWEGSKVGEDVGVGKPPVHVFCLFYSCDIRGLLRGVPLARVSCCFSNGEKGGRTDKLNSSK